MKLSFGGLLPKDIHSSLKLYQKYKITHFIVRLKPLSTNYRNEVKI